MEWMGNMECWMECEKLKWNRDENRNRVNVRNITVTGWMEGYNNNNNVLS